MTGEGIRSRSYFTSEPRTPMRGLKQENADERSTLLRSNAVKGIRLTAHTSFMIPHHATLSFAVRNSEMKYCVALRVLLATYESEFAIAHTPPQNPAQLPLRIPCWKTRTEENAIEHLTQRASVRPRLTLWNLKTKYCVAMQLKAFA
jgi:hypothetical protein